MPTLRPLTTIPLRDVTPEQMKRMCGHRVLVFEESAIREHTQTVLTLRHILANGEAFRFRGELGKQVCAGPDALITILR